MYFSKIDIMDIANGDGVRVTLFVSGCRNHCKGCFQPETWDFYFGEPYTQKTENYIIEALNHDYINGLTLLGGDPFEPENVFDLILPLKKIKALFPNKTIWCYTGYKYENLINNPLYKQMLQLIDVLVDGKFEEEHYQIGLKFKGSTNQRIIDVQESLNKNTIVLKYS